MTNLVQLETERLRLRQWRQSDREPFAALNADTRVMEHFPAPLNCAESDEMAARCERLIGERGWGFWAAELKQTGAFIGFVGLHVPPANMPCSPCVEIGWRLAHAHWQRGYASEAARHALRFAFETLTLPEIVAFTTPSNQRSLAVMARLGMTAAGTFEHPFVPEGSALRTHRLFRLSREAYLGSCSVVPPRSAQPT